MSELHAPRPVIEVSGLTVHLDDRAVLEDVSFTVEPGEFMGVIGPNGAGKTTLLRVLLGLVRAYSGTVRIFGKEPARLGPERRAIGYVPQRASFDRRFPVTALDVVMMGRVPGRGLGRRLNAEDRKAAVERLEWVGAADLAHRPIGELSGGQQQRVLLARALCRQTRLLLLDEPNTGLDVAAQEQFYDLLENLRKSRGLTVVAVSHDVPSIATRADRLLCINKSTHVHGSPAELLSSSRLEEAYRCEFERALSVRDGR